MNLAYPHSDACDLLPESTQIRGREGMYQILGFYKQRGIGRIYRAEKLPDGVPVTVREYVLPTAFFNETEIYQRKQMFKALAGMTLADGRNQDIRLVLPSEAIADPHQNRCYLITESELDTTPSLKAYQKIHGPLGETAIREFLSQTLQTLEFLHGQKFFLPNGQLQDGIIHGNLTLESLLLYPRSGQTSIPEKGEEALRFVSRIETGAFIIYVCDVSLWEGVFDPAIAQTATATAQDDLKRLGQLAFSLLTGDRPHSETGDPLNPHHDEDWPILSLPFKQYLQRLMGLHSPYATAESARRDLLRLAPAPPPPVPIPPPPPLDTKKSGVRLPWRLMLLLILLAFLAQLIAWLIAAFRNRTEPLPQQLCCMAEVAGLPSGTFTYTSEAQGTWHYIRQENLIERDKTLDQVIEERLTIPAEDAQSEENLVFTDVAEDDEAVHALQDENTPQITLIYESHLSFSQAVQSVRQRETDFLMAGMTQPSEIDLATEIIAYDGLAAIVPFSYVHRSQGLPSNLNGQISLRQLRQLYTGKITNWQELGGPNLRVQLYLPDNSETLRIVENRILGDRPSIEQFRQLVREGTILLLPTFPMFQQMLQDFEDNDLGAIGLAPMSQVFGQCSVYPLAVRPHRQQQSISPLRTRQGRAIRPSTDLCNAKGSYAQNTPVFRNQTYPLAYPISVVYRRDNRLLPIGSKFAELLRTEESQRLLQQTGLVPFQPLPPISSSPRRSLDHSANAEHPNASIPHNPVTQPTEAAETAPET